MTAAVSLIDQKGARRLVDLSKQHLGNFERCLSEIVKTRAWEALGYESFPEFYTAEYADFTLFPEMRAHVVYALFDEGASIDEVAQSVKGIGEESAKALKRQRNNGVPADMALVREHLRQSPRRPYVIHLDVGPDDLADFRRIAQELGTSIEEIAIPAVRARFAELANGV